MMQGLRVVAFAIAMCGPAVSAAGFSECKESRCAETRIIPPPHVQRGAHKRPKQMCCFEAPPGWGWYRRQRFYQDCSQPLVVSDELGGNVSVHENW